MELSLVFHSPDMPRISPVVRVCLDGSPADLVRLTRPYLDADLPEDVCDEFVHACRSVLSIDSERVAVSELPMPPEWYEVVGDRFAWFRRLIAEVRAWSLPAVLINMDPPFEITHGETLLGRWFPREEVPASAQQMQATPDTSTDSD